MQTNKKSRIICGFFAWKNHLIRIQNEYKAKLYNKQRRKNQQKASQNDETVV